VVKNILINLINKSLKKYNKNNKLK